MKRNPAKKNGSSILLLLFLLIGLSLLLYPKLSDYWNSLHQSKAIANYSEKVAELDEDACAEFLTAARAYNQELARNGISYTLSEEKLAEYNALLDVEGKGIMGYIEIPSIKVFYPIYHGTSGAVLDVAVGHLEWTSLPVGGESTHCAVSAHTDLDGARLFTDVKDLTIGDIFMLQVLDEVLTYEVDQIRIVQPRETELLQIVPGEDYCTLVTCTTSTGLIAHSTGRLLVRGHRIPNIEEAKVVRVTANAVQIEPLIIAPLLAVPILLILLIILMLPKKRRRI